MKVTTVNGHTLLCLTTRFVVFLPGSSGIFPVFNIVTGTCEDQNRDKHSNDDEYIYILKTCKAHYNKPTATHMYISFTK